MTIVMKNIFRWWCSRWFCKQWWSWWCSSTSMSMCMSLRVDVFSLVVLLTSP